MTDEYNEWAEKALAFATKAHGNQKRKYTGEPYINHPIAVSKLVYSVVRDKYAVQAALLHDVVEDTDFSIHDIQKEFDQRVVTLVIEMTDVAKKCDGNRAVRKEIEAVRLSKASYLGKTIKLADLIDNTSTITEHDSEFAKVYMKEKKRLMHALWGGSSILHDRACGIVDNYYGESDD